MSKILGFVLIFLAAVCKAELGNFIKNMIESLGQEANNIYFPQINEAFPLQFLNFKVTAINIQNLRNNVQYSTDVDEYKFLVTIESPKITIEINDKSLNPAINIKQLQVSFEISRDFKTCKSVSFTPWERIDLDLGLISSFIPEKFLNNDYLKGFLKNLEPVLKAKITQFLQISPLTLFLEQGQINVHLKKKKSITIHDDL